MLVYAKGVSTEARMTRCRILSVLTKILHNQDRYETETALQYTCKPKTDAFYVVNSGNVWKELRIAVYIPGKESCS